MAFSQKDWAVVRAFFEQGLSLSEIVARDEVKQTGITDRGSISRKSKQEGWIKGKNATLATEEIQIKQKVAEIAEKKATFSATEVEIHNTLVAERTKLEAFFRNSNVLIAKTVATKVQRDGANAGYAELNAAATAISKTQESVLGKAPDTIINNMVQTNVQFDRSPERVRAVRADLDADL
jgi:hypothetical protein